MNELNLPQYSFRIRTTGQSKEIFDSLRRKYVRLTPEEWVRQHFMKFLTDELKYPVSLIGIEKGISVNGLKKRVDIVVFEKTGAPWMIVECKAPSITMNEETFYQAANYNLKLKVNYLVVTNGLQHYCCKYENDQFRFINTFPGYGQ